MASTAVPRTRSRGGRIAIRVLLGFLAFLGLVVVGFLIWASTGVMDAEPGPLSAVENDPAVSVTDHPEAVVMTPTGGDSQAGLVFIPGAKVTAEAYMSNLSGIVEADNITVVITKPTLNLAFFDLRPLNSFTELAPGVDQWIVGGHSLGGVKACQFADDPGVRGLVLFGSYCAHDLSDSPIAALSIGGSEDLLSTPTAIQDASDKLPASAQFIQIDGASHARFGDYGIQSGDGTATISSGEMREILTEDLADFFEAA
ncbi:MAG: alpha/beta hydrolase [Arachnia sp.]